MSYNTHLQMLKVLKKLNFSTIHVQYRYEISIEIYKENKSQLTFFSMFDVSKPHQIIRNLIDTREIELKPGVVSLDGTC